MASRAEQRLINTALRNMKAGQKKIVVVGPGRTGRVLVRKGSASGGPTLIKNIGKQKRKAKVIPHITQNRKRR